MKEAYDDNLLHSVFFCSPSKQQIDASASFKRLKGGFFSLSLFVVVIFRSISWELTVLEISATTRRPNHYSIVFAPLSKRSSIVLIQTNTHIQPTSMLEASAELFAGQVADRSGTLRPVVASQFAVARRLFLSASFYATYCSFGERREWKPRGEGGGNQSSGSRGTDWHFGEPIPSVLFLI